MHIMKTAGTSFAEQINANFAPDEIFPPPGPQRRMDQYWKMAELRSLDAEARSRVRAFHGHFPFMAAELVGADAVLTLLRDPVERTISHLRHCERHFAQHRGKSLEAIYDDAWHHPLLFRNYQVKQFALTAEDQPKAHNEVVEIDADRVAIARANLDRVAVLGLTERYGAFLDEVASRFGWEIAEGPHLQVGPGRAVVPDALRERIIHDNRLDIDFYRHARQVYEGRQR